VELVCRVHNARPKPDIIWYRGGEEFVAGRREDSDDKGSLPERTTVTSILRFKPSAGDNLANIACEAQHPALQSRPLRASVKMFVQYPPGQPRIEGYSDKQPLKKGDTVTLVCLSKGGNPLATITWYRNGERVDSSYTTILRPTRRSSMGRRTPTSSPHLRRTTTPCIPVRPRTNSSSNRWRPN